MWDEILHVANQLQLLANCEKELVPVILVL